jgi:hypothetical protein
VTDIATLGLRIDSRDTVAAKKALDDLTASAKPAAAAAANMEKAGAAAGRGAKQMATGTGLARHEMINLSRQIQDVGVSLVSGQSPFMVMAQQGAQIADIFGSSKTGSVGGALKQIGSGIASVLTPMRLLAGGTALAGAAAYAAYSSWKSFALGLDDTAKQAGVLSSEMAKLQAVASFRGIASEDFTKGISNFSQQVYLSKTNAGGLLEVFRANGVAARDFTGSLEKAADLIKNAKNDQQRLVLLQQMGLPATMEWVRLMSGGAEGIRKAKEEAAAFGGAANDEMVAKARQFDEAWNKAWTNFGLGWRNVVVGAANGIDQLIQKGRTAAMALGVDVGKNLLKSGMGSPLGSNFDDFYKVTGAGAAAAPAKTTVDPAALQRSLSVQQQQLAIYGQTATAAEAVRQVELQVQQARLAGIPIDEKRIEVLKRLTAEQTIGVSAIKASTDAANIDAATVGMSTGKANEYAAAQNAINTARQAGRELTPENIAQIQREAAALGQAAAQADLLRFSYTNLVQGPLQSFTSAISNGASAWDAFKKAGQSALNAIASKLMEMAAQNLWSSAFGGSSGGGLGGLFGGLFGGGGGVMSGTGLGAGTGGLSFPMFAAGTNSAPGGWSIVGEKGPELMNVPRGAQILPNGVSPPGGGGAPVVMNDNRTIHIGQGASQETVAQLKEAFAQDRAQRFNETVAIVKRARTGRNL